MEFIKIEADILALQLNEDGGKQTVEDAAARLKQMLESQDQPKLYLEIPNHNEEDEGRLLVSLKNSLQNFSPFKKIAVVSHESWIERYSEILTEVDSAELKIFEPEEAEEARDWLKSTTGNKQDKVREPDRPPKRDAPDQDLNRT